MDHWEFTGEVHRHRAEMHARHRRVALLQRQLRDAESDRDRAVEAFVTFGEEHEGAKYDASRRAIGRQLGVTHGSVNGMVERARTRTALPAPAAPLVPVLSADQARAYVESGALGNLVRVLVSFHEGAVLLESGLDPAVFADGTDIKVPNMLIFGADGVIGVEECLAGYGGTGPSNSRRLLGQLGYPDDVASKVLNNRYLEIGPDGVLRAETESPHSVGGGLELSADGSHLILRVRSEEIRPLSKWTHYDTVAAWCREVMDEPDTYPWAAGSRRARVYLNREAAAHLQEPYHSWRRTSFFSVVVEQGRLQLWCSAIYPYNFADLLSTEQLRVLDAAQLYPANVEPRTWLDKFLPHRRERPPHLTISDDNQDLTHDPEGTTELASTPAAPGAENP